MNLFDILKERDFKMDDLEDVFDIMPNNISIDEKIMYIMCINVILTGVIVDQLDKVLKHLGRIE